MEKNNILSNENSFYFYKSQKKNINLDFFMKIAIYFYLFAIFFSTNSGEFVVKVSRIFIFLVGGLFFILNKKNKRDRYILWGILFILYNFFLILLNKCINPNVSFEFLLSFAYTFAINALVINYLYQRPSFLKILLFSISLFALIGVLRIYLKYGWNYYFNSRGDEVNGNAPGFKAVVGSLSALAICMLDTKKKRASNVCCYFLIFANFIFAVLTASRSVYILFFIPIILYLILKNKHLLAKIKYIIISVLIVVLVYELLMTNLFLYNLIGHRIESALRFVNEGNGDASTSTRNSLINFGISFFSKSKITGFGLDGFRSMMKIYNRGFLALYSHNNFIEMLVDGGIVGFVLYYFLYLVIFINYFSNKNKSTINLLGFSFFVGFLFSEWFKVTYYDTICQLMLMVCYFSVMKVAKKRYY